MMPRRLAIVGISIAIAMSLSLPAMLQAQDRFINFGIQCLPGALRACASVQAWNDRDNQTGDHYLYVRLANVQGWPGFEDIASAGISDFALNNLSLIDRPFPGGEYDADEDYGPYGYDVDLRDDLATDRLYSNSTSALASAQGAFFCGGDVGCARTTSGPFKEFHVQNQGGAYVFMNHIQADSDLYIWGCDPNLSGHREGWSTCMGSFTHRLSLGQGDGFALTEATSLAIGFKEHGRIAEYCSTNPGSFAGSAHSESYGASACTEVVPEPVTMVLLGSGLLGLGGTRALRRRKRAGVDASA